MKSILVIAGSDPSGGAGLQGDIKTATMCGVFSMAVPTCLTIQNTLGVKEINPLSPELVRTQLKCVLDDIRPDSVKIGAVPTPELIEVIASVIAEYDLSDIVVDPVMASTSGKSFSSDCNLWVSSLRSSLLPVCDFVTPNIPEAELFLGSPIDPDMSLQELGDALIDTFHCRGVVLKGGHSDDTVEDILFMQKGIDIESRNADITADGNVFRELEITRLKGSRIASHNTHGTGCCFSTCMASMLAHGVSPQEAFKIAKTFVTTAIRQAADNSLGNGNGPLFLVPDFRPMPTWDPGVN